MRINFTLFSFYSKKLQRSLLLVVLLVTQLTSYSQEWTETPFKPTEATQVYMLDANKGWIIGANGLKMTTDGGQTWTTQRWVRNEFLFDIHFTSPARGWIVGEGPLLLQTTDGGITWQDQTSKVAEPFSHRLTSIHFTNATTGWILGNLGVYQTTDGGVTWRKRGTLFSTSRGETHFANETHGWVIGAGEEVFRTTDGGATWILSHLPGDPNFIWSSNIYFKNTTDGWATQGDSSLLQTTDGGVTWQIQLKAPMELHDIYFFDAMNGWVLGEDNGLTYLLRTTDGGQTWTQESTPIEGLGALTQLYFSSPTHGWGAAGNLISTTTDGGRTWTTKNFDPLNSPVSKFSFPSPAVGWGIGEQGTVIKTIDSGATWIGQESGTGDWLTNLSFIDNHTGWISGGNGTILHTSDGGTTWRKQASGTLNYLKNVYFINRNKGYAVGENGTLLATTNGGATWTAQSVGTTESLEDILFVNATKGWIVGTGGLILSTNDGGATWTAQASGVTSDLYAITFSNSTTGWIVTHEDKTILKTIDGGATWIKQATDISGLYDIHFITPNIGWALTAWSLLKTIDGGATWIKETTPDFYSYGGLSITEGGYIIFDGGYDKIFRSKKPIPQYWNMLKGYAFIDANANGVKDPGEQLYTDNYKVITKNTTTGDSSLYHVNDHFFHSVELGSYTTRIELRNDLYSVPAPKGFSFTTYYNEEEVLFPLVPVPGRLDVSTTLLPITPSRPGFVTTYRLTYKKEGVEAVSSTLKLVKDPRLSLVSSSKAVSATKGDTLIWQLDFPGSLTSGSIDLTFRVAAPPIVNNGDILHMLSTIETEPGRIDINLANNQAKVSQVVIGSYDPNDKSEVNNGTFTLHQLEQKEALTYLIRFQNTGTDTAFNIVIRDTLDAKLDWNSVEMVGASHAYQLIQEGNQLVWTFNNIQLPDSNINERASHGYVAYKIKPKAGLQLADVITNTASIYFDYNLPVVTNTTSTTIRPTPVKVVPKVWASVSAYPNPTKDGRITIVGLEANKQYVLVVSDAKGTALKSSSVSGQVQVQLPSQPGVYHIRIKEQGSKNNIQPLSVVVLPAQ